MTTKRNAVTKQLAPKENKEKNDSEEVDNGAKIATTSPTANDLNMVEILRELKDMRRESQTSFTETKASLDRLEDSMKDVKERVNILENRVEEAENRISVTEEVSQRNERVLRYLLRRETLLISQCDDLQNRLRRNNLRIYQVPEDSEKEDVTGFVRELIKSSLGLTQIDIRIERAHRALGRKPLNTEPSRSIIVRFLDYAVKEAILRKAWAKKQVTFHGKVIYFDQDYSPDIQRKRTRIRGVIKQLKEKGIRARCRFPAQLRIDLESGPKTFPTLVEAVPTLLELGVATQVSEREKMDRELTGEPWSRRDRGSRRGNGALSDKDLQAYI